ncbi:hypothetical protein AAD001_16295 [Colwelliaceae bacterium 6471]
MEEPQKLPSDLEEQIQSLAGDIYIQIEDKISSLLSAYPSKIDVTPELVEQHEHYQSLKSAQQTLVDQLEKSSLESNKQQQELAEIKTQLANREEELKNNAELNGAKLTDTEQVLKDKLAELSAASEQLKSLKKSEQKNIAELEATKAQLADLTASLSQHKEKEDSLSKNDKAKAATLEIQNHKISELTNQLNNALAELELLKSEQSQSSDEKSESLANAQQQVAELNNQLAQAKEQVEKSIEKQATLTAQMESLQGKHQENSTVQKSRETELLAEVEQLKASLQQSKADSAERTSQLSGELSQEKLSSKQSEEKIAAQNTLIQQLKDKEVKLLDSIKGLEEDKVSEEQTERELAAELVDTKQALDSREIELAEAKGQLEQYKQQTQSLVDVISEKEKAEDEKTQEIYNIKQLSKQQADEHQQALKSVQDKLTAIEQQLENSKAECQRLLALGEKKDRDLQTQAEKHQQDLSVHRDEVAKVTDKLRLVEEKHAKDELALQQMQEQIIKTQSTWQEQLDDITSQLEKTSLSLSESQALNEQYHNEVATVSAQLQAANDNADKIQQRYEAHRTKQELEYNKARETIKYLRDENLELNTKLEQQVSELEGKLTEYRLRFEYAQKQLEKKQ